MDRPILKRENPYEIQNNVSIITYFDKQGDEKGKFIVDMCDLERVIRHKWSETNNGYIASYPNGKILLLHRFITNCPDGMMVDHINHDRRDNRRSNLRICTAKVNCNNKSKEAKCITEKHQNGHIYYIVYFKGQYKGCFTNKQKAETKVEELKEIYKKENPLYI